VRAYYSTTLSGLTNIVNSAVQYYKINTNQESIKNYENVLAQNYPYPFNPTTQIKYVISEPTFVQLKVFDPFGKEVALLVNERKEEGIYQVEFSVGSSGNAGNLSSGIYFYQLKTDNFISTKEMLVVK
jgi:hypothetical protein